MAQAIVVFHLERQKSI